MTEITFRDDVDVNLVQHMGGDDTVVASARVSTKGIESLDALGKGEGAGLINFLMKNRHGTPFEHNAMTFYVAAPIFVFREFHRHRIGWSYNEESGRYKQLDPVFYIPARDRNLVQTGKTGAYDFHPGTDEQWQLMNAGHRSTCINAYVTYERLLQSGIAKEVARMTLPVNIFSSMYATCNARSLMAYLSLRTNHPEATFPSTPMREIEMVAEQIEFAFALHFPMTYDAFVRNGRVSP